MFSELAARVIFFNTTKNRAFTHEKRQNDFHVKKEEDRFFKKNTPLYPTKNNRPHDIVYSFFYTFVGIRQNIHNNEK